MRVGAARLLEMNAISSERQNAVICAKCKSVPIVAMHGEGEQRKSERIGTIEMLYCVDVLTLLIQHCLKIPRAKCYKQ
jgi:hypothetical protein